MVFDCVQHLDRVGPLAGDQSHPDHGAAVEVLVVHLRHRHIESPANLGKDGTHDRPLALQRMDIAEQQVKFDPGYPHAHIIPARTDNLHHQPDPAQHAGPPGPESSVGDVADRYGCAMTRTTAVLLAAGAGTRLGMGPKALLPFRGATLLAHAAGELLRGGCSEVVVVIGAAAGDVRAVPLPPRCRFVENPRWQEGMGSSFAVGVAAALDGQGQPPPADGTVLVALVDQPGMDSALVSTLLSLHRPGRITAAGYRSGHGATTNVPRRGGARPPLRRGNPVLFPLDHAAGAAAAASGDSAARDYLQAHAELVDVVDFSPFTDGADVDTPGDLHLLQ